MKTLSHTSKTQFYGYLNGIISLREIESFLYKQQDLEDQLDETIYFNLLNFDFNDKNAENQLKAFLFNNIISRGEYETWNLKNILLNFLNDYENVKKHLDKLNDLYYGVYTDNGERKYQYTFLSNLGLNILYWLEEDYLRLNYGSDWKKEYENGLRHLKYYQQQLRPFAKEILEALEDSRIQIQDDGSYIIEQTLKDKLEGDNIYSLKHPDNKNNR